MSFDYPKGFEKLTKDQVDLLLYVNKKHTDCVGLDYKAGMAIEEVWLDENQIVCARLKNGKWYHYTKEYTWH